MEKLPPIEKIYEAYGAIADDRIKIDKNVAHVQSSDKTKTYTVTWHDGIYQSDDNATYWQGYPGYPVIAVLMLQDKLPLDKQIANLFYGFNWNQMNKEYRQDHNAVVDEVLQDIDKSAHTIEEIKTEVNKVYKKIEQLQITVKRTGHRPPK